MNETTCDHNCGSCSEDCQERKVDFTAPANQLSHIKKVIGIVSGKGGVGKSLVTSLLAVTMARRGFQTAILDADITGPSIPKAFGIKQKAGGSEMGIFPVNSKTGIRIMSVNLLLENDTDPVIWRGPILGGTVKQFWSDVIWDDVDYMFIDMPPGTGDVPLTVFQSLPVDGIIVVTSPQELVSMIVAKAVKMAEMMEIPVLGLVENMSYTLCPDCGKRLEIFGTSHIEEAAGQHQLRILGKLPIDPRLAAACDRGMIELFDGDWLEPAADLLEAMTNKIESEKENISMKIAVASEGTRVTGHFGHCESFRIYDTQNDTIVAEEVLANPGHKPGFLPNFLADHGVNVIISGGMGGGAVDIFNERGVEVMIGAEGEARSAVEAYLNGSLHSTGSVCHEHAHHNECGK